MENSYVTNPIPAKQIVNVNITWDCLTPPTCTTLEHSLQTIVDAICELHNFDSLDLGCLTLEEVTLHNILQELINKACTLSETNSETVTEAPWDLSYCHYDNWSCDNQGCIEVESCNTSPTNEEIIQSLISRLNAATRQISLLCDKVEELETDIEELKLTQQNCCDE